jgi:hypothetical protein
LLDQKAGSKKPCEGLVGGEMIAQRNPTSMIPRSSELRNAILAKRLAVLSAGVSFLVFTAGLAHAEDWPKFRKGVWKFERTLAIVGREGDPDEDRVLLKQEMRRCVDPSEAMKETFRPMSVGNCHSKRAERVANKYVFALRCDYMGPVRTTIDVESDAAYTEINVLEVGQLPRTDTVIARRIADCN